MIDDHFRQIEDYPGYRVSRDGEVQSRLGRGARGRYSERWLPLKPVPCRDYDTVNLTKAGEKRRRYVHRLVIEAFVGPCPPGLICRHLDGDRTNNRLENLAWGTYSENEQDKRLHGTWLMGEAINAKLTEAEVLEIRRLRGEGVRFSVLAEKYGVTRQNVQSIVHRRSWRHLP